MKTLNFRVTGLCAGNSPVAGEFPAQMASNAEDVSILWHYEWPMDSHDKWPVMQKAIPYQDVTKISVATNQEWPQ